MSAGGAGVEIVVERVAADVRVPGQATRAILEDISFRWCCGEAAGLVGRSGSGKTTLLRLLAQLERPTRGRIRRPVGGRVMVVMQRPEDHFTESTAGGQVASYCRTLPGRADVITRLVAVGLPPEASDWPLRRLSSGQMRLVAIACALATGAPFLALDEPMAGLDAGARAVVRAALRRIGSGASGRAGILIVSHHPDDLLGLVDRLLILERGRLAYDGPFGAAPLPALDACLAEPSQSLFYALRRLETGGVAVRPEVYGLRDPAAVCAALRDAARSSAGEALG